MPDAPHPWDQQPDESEKAFRAFSLYRSMPPAQRSFLGAAKLYAADVGLSAKTQRRLGNGSGADQYFLDWTNKFDWKQRAKAWDDHQRAEELASCKAIREQIQIELTHQLLSAVRIQNRRIEELTPAELTQWSTAMRGHLQAITEASTPQQLAGVIPILLSTRPPRGGDD